jgi:hypothetical protein
MKDVMKSACAPLLVLLLTALGARAEDIAWGPPRDGVRLGLALAPGSNELPSESSLEVLVHNTSSEPRLLPVSTCGHLRWTSFTTLHVRAANGRVFRFHIGPLVDVASIHPHEPVRLAPGETLRERFSLRTVIRFHGLDETQADLWPLLLKPQEVVLWAGLDSQYSSGRLKHRFGLRPSAPAPSSKSCVTHLSAGDKLACSLDGQGTPWCWGAAHPGLPAGASQTEAARPRALPLLAGALVETGLRGHLLCGRTQAGAVYCAGSDGHPWRLRGAEPAVRLHLGDAVLCARLADGALACAVEPPAYDEAPVATRLEALGAEVAHVATGSIHACAVRHDGTVWCWGDNTYGQLGTGDTRSTRVPLQVRDLGAPAVSVAAGSYHSCAVLGDGTLWCWGRGEYGELGLGARKSSPTPAPVTSLGTEVVRVAAGFSKTCAWKGDGSLWCSGDLLHEQGPGALAMTPVKMMGPDPKVEEVVFGFRHTCARTAGGRPGEAGHVFCWGEGGDGQLGTGISTGHSPPARVQGLPGGAVALTAGSYFTCAIAADTTAWCWGSGDDGQLGTGDLRSRPRPTRVRLGKSVLASCHP